MLRYGKCHHEIIDHVKSGRTYKKAKHAQEAFEPVEIFGAAVIQDVLSQLEIRSENKCAYCYF